MKEVFFTMSREYGSGGRYIAEQLAQWLGIPCYDHNHIDRIAHESGWDMLYIEGWEEHICAPSM